MAAALAESSGSCGKGLELSESYSSSPLDYSGDTFESFSEEEESKAPGSWCSTEDVEESAVSEALESTSSLAGQSHAEEESEAVDSAAVERDVMGKWIDAMGKWIDLENKETEIKPDKSVIKTPADGERAFQHVWSRHGKEGICGRHRMNPSIKARAEIPWTEIPALSPGELDALRSFCTTKISRMHREQAESRKSRKLRCGVPARETEAGDWSCVIPARLMTRVLLANTRETVKQVTEIQIHEPSACPDCLQKEAELAKIAFVRQKKTLLEAALIQEKLEEQFYSRDMLTLLGEALRSFPKPSEDPRDLWQRLKGREIESLKPSEDPRDSWQRLNGQEIESLKHSETFPNLHRIPETHGKG